MQPVLLGAAGLLLLLNLAGGAASRFDEFTKKFEHTADRAEILSSTFLGGGGTEWLAGGGFQPDGTVVAAGVALGPTLDLGIAAAVLGTDSPIQAPVRRPLYRGPRQEVDKQGQVKYAPFAWNDPNATAFIVRLSPDLKTVKSVTRFGWKCGGLTGATVDAQGNIYLCGPAGAAAGSISADAQELGTNHPPVRPNARPTGRNAGALAEDLDRMMKGCDACYLARLSPDGSRAAWVRTISNPVAVAPSLCLDKAGNVRLLSSNVRTFDASGRQLSVASLSGGTEGHLAVNPIDGSIARAGEHHWPTGREPYRDPTLNIYRPDGTLLYQLYDWDGPLVGINALRLVSDSAIRGVAYDNDGALVLHAWSDGGNSVLYREPNDVFAVSKKMDGLGLSVWGAGVLSCAYVLRVDPVTYRISAGTLWVGYLKDRNKPNSVTIDAMGIASDGSICVGGSSAWGLIRTGNAFPGEPTGSYVAVMSKDLTSLRFCSTLPAIGQADVSDGEHWAIASGTVNGRAMVMFLSGAVERDGDHAAPMFNARQEKYGGGLLDGHILLLDLGPAGEGARQP